MTRRGPRWAGRRSRAGSAVAAATVAGRRAPAALVPVALVVLVAAVVGCDAASSSGRAPLLPGPSSDGGAAGAVRAGGAADLGGAGTAVLLRGRPFHQDDRLLDTAGQRDFAAGAEVFQHPVTVTADDGARQPFSPRPGTAAPDEATGPLFVTDSCMSCHVDGLEPAPVRSPGPGTVVRVADARRAADGAAHPALGHQLSVDAVDGARPEGRVDVRWEEIDGVYADGSTYRLRRPLATVDAPAVAPADRPAVSLRVAPPLLGLGLLESVPAATLARAADPTDADGDGVSGRVARGRFGWKAAQPTVRSQTVAALAHDMGVTTGEAPDPCQDRPVDCDEEAGDRPELWGEPFDDLLLYTEAIAVPRARGLGRPAVRRGAEVFDAIGCSACHTPTLRTGDEADGVPALYADRTIHPYTDLLLHDMGPGLDDGVGEAGAAPSEWRTAPLWGLGLRDEVYGGGHYLHDGRADTIAGAVLWHGGEAAPSRDAFIDLDAAQRRDLLRFLRSL